MRWLGVAWAMVMLAGCTPFAAFHAGTFRIEPPPPLERDAVRRNR